MRKYNILFQVWFTQEEYNYLKVKANQCGVSMSEYVRSYVNDYTPKQAPSGDWLAMMKELKAIGNCVNQIAHVANATGIIDQENYHEQAQQLRRKIRDIERAVYNDGYA